jgi:hypothetical protein
VKVELVFDPPWSKARMPEAAKLALESKTSFRLRGCKEDEADRQRRMRRALPGAPGLRRICRARLTIPEISRRQDPAVVAQGRFV